MTIVIITIGSGDEHRPSRSHDLVIAVDRVRRVIGRHPNMVEAGVDEEQWQEEDEAKCADGETGHRIGFGPPKANVSDQHRLLRNSSQKEGERVRVRERWKGATRLYRCVLPPAIPVVSAAPGPTWPTVVRRSWLNNHNRTRSSSSEVCVGPGETIAGQKENAFACGVTAPTRLPIGDRG
ncbi:hypothetical protein B296_00010568 [Ensete ventricosum]|uniref:Uncharacterized protein n=1 Tax=Ensete ventricosum TaxID=4639 RepID=A0A427AV11_ENSVE|nr:hypothetical protein B296_00010568 [Ensete ventricosum]